MAPNKSSSDLMKVGLEGFAMLDEYFGQKKKRQHHEYKQHRYWYQPQKPQVQVINPVPAAVERRIDCYEAARLYGGTVIADYPNNKMARKASIP